MANNNNWGGARVGAGRPPASPGIKRGKHSIYCTADELEQVRKYLQELRTTPRMMIIAYKEPCPADCMDACLMNIITSIKQCDYPSGSRLYLHYIPASSIESICIDKDSVAIYLLDCDTVGYCRNYVYIDYGRLKLPIVL